MTKFLNLKFTGSIVLTPEYPNDLQKQVRPPLIAVMPGARRRRRSEFRTGKQVDAQFAFVEFDYAQLLKVGNDARDADFKYPSPEVVDKGVCFFEREEIVVNVGYGPITFVDGDISVPPTTNSRETRRIARWSDFASAGNAAIKAGVLQAPGEYVRVIVPSGEVASGYESNLVARIDFDYGASPQPVAYAQEIVVRIAFTDSSPSVQLNCTPFPGSGGTASVLTFTWGGKPSINLVFGNGTMTSVLNVLTNGTAGQEHEGDFDLDFGVLYDILECNPDQFGFRPLPHIRSLEILRVPCTSTMIGTPTTTTLVASSSEAETPSSEAKASYAPESKPRTLPGDRRGGGTND